MKLSNSKLIAEGVSKRWDKVYLHLPESCYNNHRKIGDKLRFLENPTKAKVDKIIGNNTWTQAKFVCDECYKEVNRIVQLGGWEYQSGSAMPPLEPTNICLPCLKRAIQLFRKNI